MRRDPKQQPDYSFKILTLGESCVGKTSILLRYTENNFIQTHLLTIGIDFKTKYITMNNKKIKLKLWDTAGQEKFRTLTQQYYKNADGILLIFDIKDRSSFDKIHSWMEQIQYNTPNNQMPIVLVGNKCDCKEKERTVKPEEMENIANEYGVCYFETSALTNKNINECFSCLCELIVKKKQITELYPEKKEQFMLEDGMKKNNDTNNKQNNGNNGKCCK